MSTAHVYTTDSIEQPTPVQDAFTSHYDLDNPLAALHDYSRLMHQHTQSQMDRACRISRRRNGSSSSGSPLPSIPKDVSMFSDSSSLASVNGNDGHRSI